MQKQCSHCKNLVNFENGRIFSNHVRWCKANPKYNEIATSTKHKISQHANEKNKAKYAASPTFCKCCLQQLDFESFKKHKLYCDKDACRVAAQKIAHDVMAEKRQHEYKIFTCSICGLESQKKIGSRREICDNCSLEKHEHMRIEKLREKENKRQNIEDLATYRHYCSFKFNLQDYPDEFDFSLIAKYGWYRPANKGNNLYGVSRDHMVSVKYGFINKIDPMIIAHPANCRLILHSENVRKKSDCCLSIEDLYARIQLWNNKYGVVAQLEERLVCNQKVLWVRVPSTPLGNN